MRVNTELTNGELQEIAEYTVRKIETYPKEYGKTVENYFDLLFPDEVTAYIMRREINRRGQENYERRKRGEALCGNTQTAVRLSRA
jgi:hypothetical protein